MLSLWDCLCLMRGASRAIITTVNDLSDQMWIEIALLVCALMCHAWLMLFIWSLTSQVSTVTSIDGPLSFLCPVISQSTSFKSVFIWICVAYSVSWGHWLEESGKLSNAFYLDGTLGKEASFNLFWVEEACAACSHRLWVFLLTAAVTAWQCRRHLYSAIILWLINAYSNCAYF